MQYDVDLNIISKLCTSALPRELDLDSVYFTKLQNGLFDDVRKLQHDVVYTIASLYPEGIVRSNWQEEYNRVLEESIAALVTVIRNHVATFVQDVIIPIIYNDMIRPLVRTNDDDYALILSDIPEQLRIYAKVDRVLDQCVADLIQEQLRRQIVEEYPLEAEVRDQTVELLQSHQQRYSQRKSSMT